MGPTTTTDGDLARARRAADEALRRAVAAVDAVAGRAGPRLADAAALILASPGRVIVTGLGKSGLVGAKIAATLSSTGTPASFVHAVDALHGDSGLVRTGDVLLAISKSGETDEVCAFADLVDRDGVPVVAITGCDGASRLAECASVALDASVRRECDPDDIVPSASTTATIVLGDALAIALMVARGFGRDDFRRFHPGGTLGRHLATEPT